MTLRIAALVAVVFGIATVFSGGRVLFGPEAARVAAGAVVPFVLWFNFVAGFAYVLAGVGLERRTAVAMAIRTGLWTVIAAFSCKHLGCRRTRP